MADFVETGLAVGTAATWAMPPRNRELLQPRLVEVEP